MTADEDRALSQSGYWDDRYSKSEGPTPTHEWLCSFADLEPFFKKNLFVVAGLMSSDNPRILHLGSGDSVIPAELASRGYTRQLCVDFSPTVVQLMAQRHADVQGVEWRLMDLRDMQGLEDGSIDVGFDKSTLDAMIYGSPWSPPEEVRENTSRYLHQVYRVLKEGGIFLAISFRQPHFMKPLLNQVGGWDIDLQILGGAGYFDYYGYRIQKKMSQ